MDKIKKTVEAEVTQVCITREEFIKVCAQEWSEFCEELDDPEIGTLMMLTSGMVTALIANKIFKEDK